MTIPFKESIKRQSTSDWYGATRYVYSNYLASSSDIIAANYFDDPSFSFSERDLLWAKLSDGYETFRFINSTTVEVATD